MVEIRDIKTFVANTNSGPAKEMIAPAISGPNILDRFMAMPFNANAGGNTFFGTRFGTIEENIGQRIARPTPFVKVKKRSK